MSEDEATRRARRRELSEVDPLDSTAYRTTTNDDHDFAAASTLPDNLHLTTSRTSFKSFRRRSSASRFTPATQLNSHTPATTENNISTAKTTGECIAEGDEDFEDKNEHKVRPLQGDESETYPTDSQRKQSVTSLATKTKTNAMDEKNDTSPEGTDDGSPLDKTSTTKSVERKRTHAALSKVAWMFLKVYVLMFAVFIAVLCIYWASWFKRTDNLVHLQYLVVSEEEQVGQMPPAATEVLTSMLNSSSAHAVGTFHFKSAEIIEAAKNHNRTVWDEVVKQVHDQHYWGAYYVPANYTLDYYTALKSADTSFNTSAITFVYETARKPQSVEGYVLSPALSLQKSFAALGPAYITSSLLGQLSTDEQVAVATNATSLLSGPWITMYDNRPSPVTVILGPIQIGLLYMFVMSFHQFNFASAMHETIREQVRLKTYLVYHLATSHGAYLVLSFVYCLMCAAFQSPYDRTFGRSGFLVLWALMYLYVAAMGAINEIAGLLIFAYNKPYIGFWIVFFMVLNLAPVFSPIPVMNEFFRYGYSLPMYNIHELTKVVFLDTYKGNMGYQIAILIVWILLCNSALPFTLKITKRHKLRVEARAKQVLENAREEKTQ